jgi:hypothetical protein
MYPNNKMARLGTVVLCVCGLSLVWPLVYRATLYARLPLAPGDPYGIADILELVFWVVLVGTSTASALIGALLLGVRRWRSTRLGLGLLLLGAASVPTYLWLHRLAARLGRG